MSKSLKSAKSGLRSVKRDWSSSDVSQPRSSQPLDWPPSPPKQPAPPKALSGSEARLKAIQEALAGYSAPAPPPPLVESTAQNKRASPTAIPANAPPPKRARQLPPDWPSKDALINSSFSIPSDGPGRSKGFSKPSPESSAGSTGGKPKVPAIFLSQEQTQILKLVQGGESVFYTGSAGTSVLPGLSFGAYTIMFTSMQGPESLFFCGKLSRLFARSSLRLQML